MQTKRLPATLAAAVAFLSLFGGVAAADVHTYSVNLSGAQEVPPVSPAGVGGCTVTLDDVTGQVTVTGSFTGCTSNATLAHLHGPAAPGANAGILITLTETGGTSGNITGGGTLSPANVANMLAGLTYLNVHTVNNGPGEMRGQVVTLLGVPSLSRAWVAVLVVLGIAGGAFVLTRRPALAG
jgi:hypothetical protein